MKRILLLFAFLPVFTFFSQKDELSFNMDLTFGSVNYSYNDIIQYYTVSKHKKTEFFGLNAVVHAGVHIPVYKREQFSLGLTPKAGIGKLIHVRPRKIDIVDEMGWEIENDPRILNALTLDLSLCAYARYGFFTRYQRGHVSVYGGYRFLHSKDNYATPVIGFSVGQDHWAVGFYTHLIRMDYYRAFSNGSREVAKSFHEFGMTVDFYIHGKKTGSKK